MPSRRFVMKTDNKKLMGEYEAPAMLVISFASDILAADVVSDEVGGLFPWDNEGGNT